MEWLAKENLWPHSKTVVGAILTLVALFEIAGLFAMIPWTLWIGFTVLMLIFWALRGLALMLARHATQPKEKPVDYVSELIKERPLP